MSEEEAVELALSFLAKQGVRGVAPTRVDSLMEGRGFLVFYEDKRALSGVEEHKLFGNLPVIIDCWDRMASFCPQGRSLQKAALNWLKARL